MKALLLKRRRIDGFALISTMMMLVLLTIIAIATMSLSAVSLRSGAQDSDLARARANARMALMIAIGELQKTLGPDKRITARGVTMAKHPAVAADLSPNSAKAWWVGAASSDRVELIGTNQKPVIWLISGLDPQATSANQIASDLFMDREIVLYGENSIDLNLTGGEEITAGRVPIADQETNQITGSYAYFIDDNGMKAQLAPARSDLVNTEMANRKTGTVIPGAYDLSILDGMSGMQGVPPSEFAKLHSYNSLSLLGTGGKQVARNKRMSYTTSSLGVLSDVKRGGLKKDLTIAFEKHTTSPVTKTGTGYTSTYPKMPSYPVFDSVFPKTSASQWGDYLLLDESRRAEFSEQGYIHWGMLRDFYNIKRYIRRQNGQDCLAPVVISEWQMHGSLSGAAYGRGAIAPHSIGLSSTLVPNLHIGLPYGDYRVAPNLDNIPSVEFIEYYKHSPLTPILGQLQYNCWVERAPADLSLNPSAVPPPTEAIVVCAQMWGAHYNPYNIGLFASGRRPPNPTESFTFQFMPDPVIRVRDSDVKVLPRELTGPYDPQDLQSTTIGGVKHWLMAVFFEGSPEGRRYTVRSEEMIGPGRAMFTAFENNFDARKRNSGGVMVFGTDVRDLVTEAAKRTFNVQGNLPPSLDWGVSFGDNGLFTHGVSHRGSGEWFASQFLWDAFPKSTPSSPNSQLYDYAYLPNSTYNDNSRLSFNMRLRSTREAGSSIRPLVDGNLRATYMNRRWDQPLHPGMDPGTRMIAAYEAVDSESDVTVERVPQMSTQADGRGFGYWGAENTPFFGFDRVILFDIPRKDLVSLGQLQHANVGRFSYEPSYIIGNSYANPRIPRNQWKASHTDSTANVGQRIAGSYAMYDASYLANEALWDSYTFTTIPQVKDNYLDPDEEVPSAALFTSILRGEKLLPNPRHLPYQPSGSKFDMATLQADEAVHYNAGHLMVDGAFNVNSTSVDAWEAFLSGTHGMPYQKIDANGIITGFEAVEDDMVRFPRVQSVFGKEMKSDSPDENYWVGFRALKQEEVRELAEAIVGEIRARGPFLSMADFVNRKLEMGEHGHMGALQAALDKTVNANIDSDFTLNATHPNLPPNAKQAAGFPGQLLQGDILQALAPCMTVRSDAFTIRAYGESIDPSTGKVNAKAWCEAIVQRFPDPVPDSGAQPYLSELAEPSSLFGRQFRITSFRWLNPNEI